MQPFTLSAITMGIPFDAATFDAPDKSDALWLGRGYVGALCELRPDFEIGARYRPDHVVFKKRRIMDDTTFVAECEIVERDGQVGAIWRVPAPRKSDWQ